jgi:dTDP-4-amino-4,6-dideoxy-D-galactose acyltransferase
MSGESSLGTPGPLVPLAWDTDNFGFPVARLVVPEGDLAAAADALARARQREIALVYWQTEPTVEVPRALLAEFGGSLMDRKATFAADLSAVERSAPDECAGDLRIREYPFGKASDALQGLAVSAGAFSRYGRDPHFPNDKFVAMYLTWIERSTRHELADVVLEAAAEGADPLGFVTVSEAAGIANIGLIAVSSAAQGRGLGRLLMRAAHRWMIGRGATRATVVTQQDNVPACRLYERCAYRLAKVKHYYHFWPLAGRR